MKRVEPGQRAGSAVAMLLLALAGSLAFFEARAASDAPIMPSARQLASSTTTAARPKPPLAGFS